MKRFPREYSELRVDLSRDAFAELLYCLDRPGYLHMSELENLRNEIQNIIDRFDEKLLA